MNQQSNNSASNRDANLFQTLETRIYPAHFTVEFIIKVFQFLTDTFIPNGADVNVAVYLGFYFSNVSHDYKLPVLVDGNARWLPGHMMRTAPPAPGAADEPAHKYASNPDAPPPPPP